MSAYIEDIYARLREIAEEDMQVLERKDKEYGRSWCKRGGVGAFMMLARKWDRLETQVRKDKWDIFETLNRNDELTESVLETVRDLRRYLFLIEEYVNFNLGPQPPREYVNPDLDESRPG